MSITDELRKYADRLSDEAARKSEHGFSPVAMALEAIADRIDAEHEAKVSYWQGASYKDGYDEGFASADDWLGQHEDAMAEHGWVKLPVDADGEVIHGGDVMVKPDGYSNRLFTVDGMTLCGDQWSVQGFEPHKLRHHKPTVEDVLREFAEKIIDSQIPNVHPTYEEAIAEYAAKLRLAEEGE